MDQTMKSHRMQDALQMLSLSLLIISTVRIQVTLGLLLRSMAKQLL